MHSLACVDVAVFAPVVPAAVHCFNFPSTNLCAQSCTIARMLGIWFTIGEGSVRRWQQHHHHTRGALPPLYEYSLLVHPPLVIENLLPRAPATGVTQRCREYTASGSVQLPAAGSRPETRVPACQNEHHERPQPVVAVKCADVSVAGCGCHAGLAGSSAKRRPCRDPRARVLRGRVLTLHCDATGRSGGMADATVSKTVGR